MKLELSSASVPMLIAVDSVPSTNTELVRRASAHDLPNYTTLLTQDQTAGRGRLGRQWIAPGGTALAVSVLVRPKGDRAFGPRDFGWLPIAAGVAMVAAVSSVLPHRSDVAFKWPNDVQIDGRKVCGILAELLPGEDGVVIGSGINLTMTSDQLPVPTATSIMLAGGPIDCADRLLSHYLRALRGLIDQYFSADADADASGLLVDARAACSTIGREVRVELPGGGELRGTASDLDRDGRLVVVTTGQRVEAVAAGDVTHVR